MKSAATRDVQVHDAVRSLAGFLNMVKQCEAEQLHELLATTRLWGELSPEQRASLDQEQVETPAYLFEQPDLDPSGDVAPIYLDDLASLAARVPPHESGIDDLLRDVALFLRQDGRKMGVLIEKHVAAVLEDRLAATSPVRKAPLNVGRALLDLLAEERGEFLYGSVSVELAGKEKGSCWLLGLASRLVLLQVEPHPQALWRADSGVTVEIVKRLMSGEARLSGGTWLAGDRAGQDIRIAGPRFGGVEAYFKPLTDWKPVSMRTAPTT